MLRLVLQELGHVQPPTPTHCDNERATGITNDTVKKQRSRSMEMRFFWVTDRVNRRIFNIKWHPGQENLAHYLQNTLTRGITCLSDLGTSLPRTLLKYYHGWQPPAL
eukprot:CCRYP_002814-RC/>CCRYP_002814-RC protein AED:0.45 eAED:0.45 QI:0/-1/0/1/-1/0/1/0/106